MARRLFAFRGVRFRNGELAAGTTYVAYTDPAGTVLADVSDTSGGASLAGSSFTLGTLGNYDLYGPPAGTDTLYLRCSTDPTLGVQRVISDPDERLDALEAGGGGGVTDHGALTGLADDDHPQYETSAEAAAKVTTHEAAADPHPGYLTTAEGNAAFQPVDSDLTAVAGLTPSNDDLIQRKAGAWANRTPAQVKTDLAIAHSDLSGVTANQHHNQAHAISGADHTGTLAHSALSGLTSGDDHTQYLQESTLTTKGDLYVATGSATVTRIGVGADDQVLTADSVQSAGVKWAAAAGGGMAATLFDAKGDIIAATAADTAARLPAGADGTQLVADAAQATGLRWVASGAFPQTIPSGIVAGVTGVGTSNTGYYMLVQDGGVQAITGLVVRIGTSSGNISVAVYSSTGSGRTRAPNSRLATSGAVASPGTGEQTISLGGSVTIVPYETWFFLSADNTTVTFQRAAPNTAETVKGLVATQATAHPAPVSAASLTAGAVNLFWIAGT